MENLSLSAESTIATATALYNALHSQTVSAYHTTNATMLFMFATVGALLSVAGTFLFGVSATGLLTAATMLLVVVPLIVFLMYIVWFREQLRILRNSTYLIGLELRISKLIGVANDILSQGLPTDVVFASKYANIFSRGTMTWEYWLRGSRGPNGATEPVLLEGGIFLLVAGVMVAVAAGSMGIGIVLLGSFSYPPVFTSDNPRALEPPIDILLARCASEGWGILGPISGYSPVLYNSGWFWIAVTIITSVGTAGYILGERNQLIRAGLHEADRWPTFSDEARTP